MQDAETVLDVLRERGRRGLPLERLYRQLFNPQLYLLACVQRNGRKPLVAQFGGIPLRRQKKAILIDRLAVPGATRPKGKELIVRVRAGRCELCEQKAEVHVHHVRALVDLIQPGRPQPAWAQLMAKRRRKTLVVCRPCHDIIHAWPPTATPMEQVTGEP
jgi:hypothetical protein